jgi:hypothetical protein
MMQPLESGKETWKTLLSRSLAKYVQWYAKHVHFYAAWSNMQRLKVSFVCITHIVETTAYSLYT